MDLILGDPRVPLCYRSIGMVFVFFVLMVLIASAFPIGDKECNVRKSRSKRAMDGKAKKTTQITARTKRSASGCNWEIFKSIVNSSTSTESNSPKNGTQKKPHALPHKSYAAVKPSNYIDEAITDDNAQRGHKKQTKQLTKQLAIDCEMVGIGDGTESMIARVSIVNRYGICMYDKYVKPREKVQDYRTRVSGIRPQDIQNGEDFNIVQKEVAEMLRGRILVGHGLKHDLDVLFISHPRKHLRDTSTFKAFRQLFRGNTPSLKNLSLQLLGTEIQVGEHSSVEDAKAAMQLYMLYRNKWESEHTR